MHIGTCTWCGQEFRAKYRGRTICPGACARAVERHKSSQKWFSSTPERQRAHRLVHEALEKGELSPQPCEVCGTRLIVVAHHDDYAAPLNVRWLCRTHHKDHHNQHGPGKNSFREEISA